MNTNRFLLLAAATWAAVPATAASAQVPRAGEVRQLVSFTFLPGRAGEATALYRDEALPLYEADEAMWSFRAFREAESPVPIDLLIVRGFDGMAGMDASNEALGEVARAAGTSIGSLYGRIGALSSGHTDQFVEMLPALGSGDPATRRLTAFFYYDVVPGGDQAWEREIQAVSGLEAAAELPSSTGRFLLSDGWTYLRMVGFDSLGAYDAYLERLRTSGVSGRLGAVTSRSRQMILVNVPELQIR